MDANGTRHHLLQGAQDWARFRLPDGRPAVAGTGELAFDGPRGEITLWPQVFRFPAGRDDRPVALADRRASASDALGNWYWIDDDGQRVLVRSAGDDAVGVFWPPPAVPRRAEAGGFGPAAPPPAAAPRLQGLAVTDDHQLIVGRLDEPGLLAFDLAGGGAPRAWRWPLAFEPFDIVARVGGGVWVLDRAQRRLWPLDRRLEVATADCDAATAEPQFQPAAAATADRRVPRVPLRMAQGRATTAAAPLAIDVLPDGAVLLLDAPGDDGFAGLWLHERDGRVRRTSTADLARHLAPGALGSPARWAAHDLAVQAPEPDDPPTWRARVHVVGVDGNQAFVFGLADDGAALLADALPLYQPLRLFGGRALVAAAGRVWYDCGAGTAEPPRFIAVVAQPRQRWVERGEALTPVLDSGVPGCVWHRVLLDGRFPPEAGVQIESRCADDWRLLVDEALLSPAERAALGPPPEGDPAAAEPPRWQREPDPAVRASGSEQPWRRPGPGRHAATLETLLQRAHGRYLQLRLVLTGNGRATPRVRALRVHHPRFSYLARYLPAAYREDADSEHFLERFLANPEGLLTSLEDRIAAAQRLWDPRTTPPEALDWLAGWFGVLLDPAWDEARRRFFLRHALRYFGLRGTLPGLRAALALALDHCVDERVFARSEAAQGLGIRIVEHFRRRHTPAALLGPQAVDGGVALPVATDPAARWSPAMGAAELLRRWRADAGGPAATTLPLQAPPGAEAAARWAAFCGRELGFVPQSGGGGAVLQRRWWAFLARRHRQPSDLVAAWRLPAGSVARFEAVPLPASLPADGAPLADWLRFEGTALAMAAQAHRFTVLLPVPPRQRTDTAAQQRRLQLARRVLELEKPAHTVFELRFYWAAFRLGVARLGSDTLVDLGSRAPQLMPPLVLGQGALAQAHLATPDAAMPGFEQPGRLQLGRDRIGRSTRL